MQQLEVVGSGRVLVLLMGEIGFGGAGGQREAKLILRRGASGRAPISSLEPALHHPPLALYESLQSCHATGPPWADGQQIRSCGMALLPHSFRDPTPPRQIPKDVTTLALACPG